MLCGCLFDVIWYAWIIHIPKNRSSAFMSMCSLIINFMRIWLLKNFFLLFRYKVIYSDLPNCRGGGGSNKLKWVAFSEINRPKTKNYPTRSYKILQNPEFTPPPTIRQVRVVWAVKAYFHYQHIYFSVNQNVFPVSSNKKNNFIYCPGWWYL